MKKVAAIVLVVSFATASSGLAAGPIETAATRAARDLAQRPTPSSGSNSRAMTWGGVGLIAGGIALIVVANGSAKHSECKDILSGSRVIGRECEESTNGALAGTGLGLAALGSVLTIKSVRKDVQIRGRSVAVRVRF